MDQQWLNTYREEIGGFSNTIHSFAQGEIARKDYKGISGGFGSYAQRDAAKHMLRLRLPGGRVTPERLHFMAQAVQQYHVPFLKLTTCEAIQMHDLTPDEVPAIMEAAIPCGIGKINVDTDIRLAVTRNFRELFRDHPELKEDARVGGVWKLLDEKRDAFDPRAFLAPIMDTVMYGAGDEGAVARITDAMRRGVKEAVGTLIVEFGSYGKAPLVEPATLEDMEARYAKEG